MPQQRRGTTIGGLQGGRVKKGLPAGHIGDSLSLFFFYLFASFHADIGSTVRLQSLRNLVTKGYTRNKY